MSRQPVLINGAWTESNASQVFHAVNPATRESLEAAFPVSSWEELESVLKAADAAFQEVQNWPGSRFADFLEGYADEIEKRQDALVEMANLETALPVSPRLRDGEFPRTTNQLRQAAEGARTGSWSRPIIDTTANIRSKFAAIGPVVVMGPNNFPFAFNSIAGGDFAAAVAAGNPVIAKGHPSHPGTTKLFAEAALAAAKATKMPDGFVQLVYRTSHEDGARLVSDHRVGAIGYTGSRHAGLALKKAADEAGKPIYLELSSINPVCILPGSLRERSAAIVDEFVGSCLMGTGQFCTNPGLVLLLKSQESTDFIHAIVQRFQDAPSGVLLAEGVLKSVSNGVQTLQSAGAELLCGGADADATGFQYQNTLLKVDGEKFLERPEEFQTEAFGNESLIVVANDVSQLVEIAAALEGNLTGCIYSDTDGTDDDIYNRIEPKLRQRVGRLLNDKMPTGVAVSPAMNHGGPFPATGHPGFTAVGMPTSIQRFAQLLCYDNVRPNRLPAELQDESTIPGLWRCVDGQWTQDSITNPAS
ncbi:aldehyde dehydrogenase (NADP(+)) [Thalassoroseus pseudoceratinae]|uniref:aldehyde dehydrogenase (NADP(+)) n=1 Tax=Thalassoroseus pseudoceratinae TaxID=2713176 RepID=UPI001424856F|nr:aldehyde dehydrogenase (NADP(+)) [Thalassoroseus pseudoceratinae]